MNCEKHAERIAAVEVETANNKRFVKDVHDDHENTKKEMSKIKATIATWSTIGALIGSGLFKIICDVNLTWFQSTVGACKMVLGMIFPDSFAGN